MPPLGIILVLLLGIALLALLWAWQRRPSRRRAGSQDWLDHATFERYLTQMEVGKVPSPIWSEARMVLLSSQANAALVAQQAPTLTPDLQDLLGSLLPLAELILTAHTSSYLAKQNVERTHSFLQSLRNRVILPPGTNLDLMTISNQALQQEVQSYVITNRQMDPDYPNKDG